MSFVRWQSVASLEEQKRKMKKSAESAELSTARCNELQQQCLTAERELKDKVCLLILVSFIQLWVITFCLLLAGRQEEHPACRNWVVRCCCGYLSGARCRCHYHLTSSLASFKSRLVLAFWYRLTQFVLEKWPLNGCSSSSSLGHNFGLYMLLLTIFFTDRFGRKLSMYLWQDTSTSHPLCCYTTVWNSKIQKKTNT